MKAMQVFVDEKTLSDASQLASTKGVTRSVIVRWAIAEYIKKHLKKEAKDESH